MMKKVIISLAVCLILACCNNRVNVHKEYMTFDEIISISSFPTLLTLKTSGLQSVDIPDFYIRNFEIYDSLLFVDTNNESGFLDIISVGSMKSYGRYLNKGKAKGEFPYGVNLTLQTTFTCSDDSVFAFMYNQVSGHMFRLNVTRTILEKKASITEMDFGVSLPHSAFWAKILRDTVLIMRNVDEIETRQNRTVFTNLGITEPRSVQRLNDFEIPLNEDFNIMSSLVSVSPTGNRIAEALIGMNYINVYSLDGEVQYTVCVGNELDKLSDILATSKYNRKYMFADLRTFNFGFAVLKYDITEHVFQSGEYYTPSILFFDWSGNPLGEVKSEIKFNHFDYDEFNNMLYVLDSEGTLRRCCFTLGHLNK